MVGLLIIAGFVFSVASGFFLYRGLTLETVVPATGADGLLPHGMDGIANLGLMHNQAMLIVLGSCAAIVAAIFLVGAALAHLNEVAGRSD